MLKIVRFLARCSGILLTSDEVVEVQRLAREDNTRMVKMESDNEKLRAALVAIQEGDTGEFTPAQVAGTVLQEANDR